MGFLVMDTVCFLNYISGNYPDGGKFDYEGVKAFIEEQKVLLTITPYTLYECIQGCRTIEEVRERGQQMMRLWDFWVLNMNGIIGKEYAFEFGPDFSFSLHLGNGTTEDFLAKRKELRLKVIESLTPRIILMSQMVAVVYMLATEGNNKNGTILKKRIELALSEYFLEQPNFRTQTYCFFETPSRAGLTIIDGILTKTEEDAKDSLNWLIHSFAVQIMNVTRVIVGGGKMSMGELNHRIITENYKTADDYDEKEMRDACKAFLKQHRNEITIKGYVDGALKGNDTIFKHLFKKVLTDWFLGNGAGRNLMNTVIDYVNVGVVESLEKFPVVYMTEEKKFVELIMGLKDKRLELTQAFYDRYYFG